MGMESSAIEEEQQPPLPSIPEEGAGDTAKLSKVAACLLMVLQLEVAGSSMVRNLPLGAT